jgi:acetyltransferase-like isoleucine patch superfamily enzyme
MINNLLFFIFRLEFVVFAMIYKKAFKSCGKKFRLQNPVYLSPRNIDVGDHVMIWKNARIEAVLKYNKKLFNPLIIISNEVTIQQNVHITCANKIYIGEGTALAANVSITDINHPYLDIQIAPEKQDIEVDEVYIGSNCKIYNNVVILPGTKLGNHCIVGANSVVKKGIYPDHSVIVGSPSRIVKQYNFQANKWN